MRDKFRPAGITAIGASGLFPVAQLLGETLAGVAAGLMLLLPVALFSVGQGGYTNYQK